MIEEITATEKSVRREPRSISSLSVAGFKSISQEQSIEIKPLTILAGANSSGKSSIIQPLLLLKQTLEATYNPGPLKIDGPNIKFDAFDQFLSVNNKAAHVTDFAVSIGISKETVITTCFSKLPDKPLEVQKTEYQIDETKFSFRKEMSPEEIFEMMPSTFKEQYQKSELLREANLKIERVHSFLRPVLRDKSDEPVLFFTEAVAFLGMLDSELMFLERRSQELIHIPGVRGLPARFFPQTVVGPTFPGTFEVYTGSVIWEWQQNEPTKIQDLQRDLANLQLGTSEIQARKIGDIQIEVLVSRLPSSSGSNGSKNGSKNKKHDMVSLADVGLGVSHTLSVLVALQAARPGQLVYIEQPEIHLHPKAQVAMAQILANAATRGVRVVVETHSELMLLAVQTLIAEGKLSPNLVKLHWFERDKGGVTKITPANLDEDGAFGEWPQDFGSTVLQIQKEYLDAVSRRYYLE